MRRALTLLLLLAAGPAMAQSPILMTRRHAESAPKPDESALRYYAAEKLTARVDAETERLRRRHPGWQPPADLWTAEPGQEDEGPYWDMLAAGRLDELRAALAARSRTDAKWRPSHALSRQMKHRELRTDALGLAHAGRWIDLVGLVRARSADIDETDVELAWAIAEALARADRTSEANALLARVMAAPRTTPEERRATILRGLAVLPVLDVGKLLARGQPGEFDAIAIDITRARISARLHDVPDVALSSTELAVFEVYAASADDPNQAGLVAWHAFKRRDFPEALTWFKRSIARGGDAMIAHGLAHTLRQLGHRREAEEVAYAWREPLVNNTLLFLDILEADLTRSTPESIEAERLLRYAQVVAAVASGEGAQALAWYAYNTCQFETALHWFKRAVAWFPKEATVYGYALTLRRQKRQREFVEVVNRYDGLFPKVVDLLFREPEDKPLACEAKAIRANEIPSVRTAEYLDLVTPVDARRTRIVVPQPGDLARPAAAPLVKRNEFPIAVQMENDLRFAPSSATSRDAVADLRWPDRSMGRPSVVARRVPGVGAMPYERFGFTLKVGWNGAEAASGTIAAEQPPPIGTLWHSETRGIVPDANEPHGTSPDRTLSTNARVNPQSPMTIRAIQP
ncbi:hypothetical protein [Methylobacterium iners]|uniref:Tetratricopeptide repeat protein n=1 Tax=Methylobacterium iners TaxID=418707 RepID=A0ABQ4S063_9HYPH|nr:hypothetical protein [Methylobacterium iners]GJD95854.1 hypothetical protein OCOJLMKI_3070 [Methylobacterium iners]